MTALNKDIADFYVSIQDAKRTPIVEHHLAYNSRTIQIKGDDISNRFEGQLDLCVLAKNSQGAITSWFDSQCIQLPRDFKAIKAKYWSNNGKAYTIHSVRKHIRARTSGSESTDDFLNSSGFAIISMNAKSILLVFVNILLILNKNL